MNAIKKNLIVMVCFMAFSCEFLDVVPDNTPTVDHAFKNRIEAEAFLYGCFSYLPRFGNPGESTGANPAILGGEEAWWIENSSGWNGRTWNIARGRQNTSEPIADYWASRQAGSEVNGGNYMFTALNDCNVFLENIHKPYDLTNEDRVRWIAEIKFLKAYYHFWLLRMYGPIPIINENKPLSAKGEEAWLYREPIDKVVDYIVSQLDEAVIDLPDVIYDQMAELGRPTKATASAVKAQALLWAASPLLNGSAEQAPYFSLVDNRDVELFPKTYSVEKWQRAADAAKEAIDLATFAGHKLYDFRKTNPNEAAGLNEKTILAMQVRGAATERWNSEIIWADSRGGYVGGSTDNSFQTVCHPAFFTSHGSTNNVTKNYAPTLQVVEQFYTKNGIPVEDDKEWVDHLQYKRDHPDGMWKLRTSTEDDRYHVFLTATTVQLHFDREARFYGSVSFDGGLLYGNSRITNDKDLWRLRFKNGEMGGGPSPTTRYPVTGSLVKKMLHFRSTVQDAGTSAVYFSYPYPIIRLADLYLMYAEALNEAGGATPDPDVYIYINAVRERTGLEGVVESWRDYAVSGKENKPLSKEGMREIIRRERLNELAFESHRFWDLRRWMLAEEYMNRPIRGWDISGATAETFYKEQNIFRPSFQKKDYFWPIKLSTLLKNPNLKQNPGW